MPNSMTNRSSLFSFRMAHMSTTNDDSNSKTNDKNETEKDKEITDLQKLIDEQIKKDSDEFLPSGAKR